MKINSNNCEAFFLDYYEGNLSKEGVEELFAFLTLNPELREVFDSYDEVSFSPDKHIHFEGKADLKKSVDLTEGIHESNYEEYFVSEVEGLLSAEEKIQLTQFIAVHPEKAEELDLLRKAILEPEEHIVYEHKASLMKSVLVSEENFEEMAIASVEGLLNSEEEKVLAASIAASAEQQKTYSLYRQTKFTADETIVFEDKESLKHKERGAFYWMSNIQFAAAAAIGLFIGIFFWNYDGNETGTTIAKVDTATIKMKDNSLSPKTNDRIANTNTNDIQPQMNKDVNSVRKNQFANTTNPPVKIIDEKEPFVAFASNSGKQQLKTNTPDPQVDFSGAYYDNLTYGTPNPVAGSQSISPRQAAMRWMKKKLDRTPAVADSEEDETMMAYAPSTNGDVSGFDLTSSAVDALAHATGTKLHLGKESEGTILTVGKYSLMLNRNN